MVSTLHLQGRAVSDQDLFWLRQVREVHPDWSRKRLARNAKFSVAQVLLSAVAMVLNRSANKASSLFTGLVKT